MIWTVQASSLVVAVPAALAGAVAATVIDNRTDWAAIANGFWANLPATLLALGTLWGVIKSNQKSTQAIAVAEKTETKIDEVHKLTNTNFTAVGNKLESVNSRLEAATKEITATKDASAKEIIGLKDASAKEIAGLREIILDLKSEREKSALVAAATTQPAHQVATEKPVATKPAEPKPSEQAIGQASQQAEKLAGIVDAAVIDLVTEKIDILKDKK